MYVIASVITCEDIHRHEQEHGQNAIDRIGVRPGDYGIFDKQGFIIDFFPELRPEGLLPWQNFRNEPNFRKYYDSQLMAAIERQERPAHISHKSERVYENYPLPFSNEEDE